MFFNRHSIKHITNSFSRSKFRALGGYSVTSPQIFRYFSAQAQEEPVRKCPFSGATLQEQKSAGDNSEEHLALVNAAIKGDLATVVQKMASKGASVNTLDSRGITPIMAASLGGHMGVFDELMKHVDTGYVNTRNSKGQNALMMAALHGHTDIVKKLMQLDDIMWNIQDDNGLTALHHAAKQAKVNSMKEILQEEDVDISLKTKEGATALDFLREHEDKLPVEEVNHVKALILEAENLTLKKENLKMRETIDEMKGRLGDIIDDIDSKLGDEKDELDW